MARSLGLRGKSVLALLAVCLLVSLLAGAIAWRAAASMQIQLGTAYTRNFTLLNRERILAPVARELALALRFAESHAIRAWLKSPRDAGLKAAALQEAESFRRDFADHSYFLAAAASGHYYFNDDAGPFSAAPRYVLDARKTSDSWFFNSLGKSERYNINVDPSAQLGKTKVWINVMIKDGERTLGIAGTGLDLSTFLRTFLNTEEPGVTPMIIDVNGAIQGHPEQRRIAFNVGVRGAAREQSLFGLLDGPRDEQAARAALAAAVAAPGSAQVFSARLDGKRQLVALSFIPQLNWHVLTAVDLDAVDLFERGVLHGLVIAAIALLVLLAAGFAYAVNRLVLKPLLQLKEAALEVAGGNYAVTVPHARRDEIGELGNAFATMADKVRRHTESLEQTVRERTQELVAANADMAAAHKKISDSISYASLIQRAILPDRQLTRALGENHFVLWRPRDVVGGDFYVYREVDDGCLIGVVDCAGHGVPGAFMTMLARAAIDQAIDEAGATDPAAILTRTDAAMRAMLNAEAGARGVATVMDAGLAYVDLRTRCVTFAGAKIGLYWCEGGEVDCVAGERRAIGDRRAGAYRNHQVELRSERSFLLTTDGFLDQAGGEKGFGFGNTRFIDMLRSHAHLPLAEQGERFAATLAAYQGEHAQRDDITVVCFRFT